MVTVEEGADISLFKDFQPPDDKDAGSPKPEAKKEAEVAPQKKLEPKPEPTREAPKPPVASAPTKRNDAKTEDAKPQPPKSAAPQPATTAENGIVGVRWGQGVAKTALAKKLAADQKSYREKYGRSGQKVLTSQ